MLKSAVKKFIGFRKYDPMISRRRALTLLGLLPVSGVLSKALKSTDNAFTQIQDAFTGLRRKLKGDLVLQESVNYESIRADLVWSAIKPKERPVAIVQAENLVDVEFAVKYARENGLKVSTRGRGHHVSAPVLYEGGVAIDLERLNKVEIDRHRRIAVVEAGISGGQLWKKLRAQNLAFPVGHCPSVPLSGFLLGGGLGWNSREWGVGCSNVIGVDLVTSEGDAIYADAKNNQDFFWAACGSGPGFFGLVTRYHLKLYDRPGAILASSFEYPAAQVETVAPWLIAISKEMPPNLELTCHLKNTSGRVGNEHRILAVTGCVFAKSYDEAKSILRILESCPIGATKQNLYFELPIGISRPTDGPPLRRNKDHHWTNSNPTDKIVAMCEPRLNPPSPLSYSIFAFDPCPEESVQNPSMIHSLRGSTYINIQGAWEDAKDDAENMEWLKNASSEFDSISIGHYVNECHFPFRATGPSRCFSPANWAKLQSLRKKYDPKEVFTYFGQD